MIRECQMSTKSIDPYHPAQSVQANMGQNCKLFVTGNFLHGKGYPTSRSLICQPFPKQALVFTCLPDKSFENTEGKGEIACNEQFLLFPQHFYLFGELSAIFNKFEIVYKLF